MEAARPPAITLTDPFDRDQAPSPAQSPVREAEYGEFHTRIGSARPTSPASRAGAARPDSASSWHSPGRLIRTLSSHNSHQNPAAGGTEINGRPESPSPIDPLSQHILNRTFNTTTQHNSPWPRNANNDGSMQRDEKQPPKDQPSAPAVQEPISRTDSADSFSANRELKKGVKAVSFLSRLMGSKKKEAPESARDDESVLSDGRPEGNNAEVFTQNFGYNPRHPQPPAYIKVGARHQRDRDFDRLFLAQELECASAGKPTLQRQGSSHRLRRKTSATAGEPNTIWAMEFSKDGKYLAAAGADKIVRVWAVLSSKEDRKRHEQQEYRENEANGVDANAEHLSAPVFQKKPIREFEGHTSTILDLSWSKNNFLLSSSMDKTVRLWHITRPECLCTFKHNDFVPSIAFHPKDDRFFLAGSLDSKLRLWSIPDKSVAFATHAPDMITAVAFTPDGKSAMAGCLSGLCMFYETEGLKYQTQIHVRSTRGQNAKGSKITGIQAQHSASGDLKILITSNDSRIRLYNFRDKSLELKVRGGENNCSQIRASLSDDGRYVLCGSEDRKAYIWSLHRSHGEKRDKTPVEMFEANDSITTAVCMAPTKTRLNLSRSEDPIYDLCNPPPVTLLSQGEQSSPPGSMAPPPKPQSERPPTTSGSSLHLVRTQSRKESPAYLSRSIHKGGNIIATADFNGRIKVFRQDCAWEKRQRDDTDRSSLFSKRGNRSGRPGSLATKASQPSLKEQSIREPRTSTSTQAPTDRILTWRQGMEADSTAGSMAGSVTDSKTTSRSASPPKSLKGLTRINTNESASSKPTASTPPSAVTTDGRSPTSEKKPPEHSRDGNNESAPPSTDATPKEKDDNKNPLDLEGGRSYLYWDNSLIKAQADRVRKNQGGQTNDTPSARVETGHTDGGDHLAVRPPVDRMASVVSKLSDDVSSAEEDEFEDAREEEMKCPNCGSVSFSARRTRDGTTLVCAQCGTLI